MGILAGRNDDDLTEAKHIGFQAVAGTDRPHADAIALGENRQAVAGLDHMPLSLAVRGAGELGALGRVVGIVAADAVEDGASQLGLIATGGQQALLLVVGDEAGLDNFCWCDPVKSDKTPDGEYKAAQLVV